MGHIGEESALCLAGTICLSQCIFQQSLFLTVTPGFFIYTAEAKDNTTAFISISGTDRLHLKIAQFAAAGGAEIDKGDRPGREYFIELFP